MSHCFGSRPLATATPSTLDPHRDSSGISSCCLVSRRSCSFDSAGQASSHALAAHSWGRSLGGPAHRSLGNSWVVQPTTALESKPLGLALLFCPDKVGEGASSPTCPMRSGASSTQSSNITITPGEAQTRNQRPGCMTLVGNIGHGQQPQNSIAAGQWTKTWPAAAAWTLTFAWLQVASQAPHIRLFLSISNFTSL